MNLNDFNLFLEEFKSQLKSITYSLLKKNQDYTESEINNMVKTAIWQSKNKKPTLKEIYLNVLNRILEEKGLSYNQGELTSPFVKIDEPGMLENNGEYDALKKQPFEVIDEIFNLTDLTQDEVFVTALSFNMSTPEALKGKYKKILDNIEGVYYIRTLTIKEIAMIMEISPKKVISLKKTAFAKMEKYCELNGIHWAEGN